MSIPSAILQGHTAPKSKKVTKRTSANNKLGALTERSLRTWTHEDERILLQGRLQRLPYKQISETIGKTELACRLHYHQMIAAKRSPHARPGRSIVFFSPDSLPEVHHLSPQTDNARSSSGTVLGSSLVNRVRSYPTEPSVQAYSSSPESCSRQRSVSPLPTASMSKSAWRPATSPYAGSSSPAKHRASYSVELACLNDIFKEHTRDIGITIATKCSSTDTTTSVELEQAFSNPPASEQVGLGLIFFKLPGSFIPRESAPVSPPILSSVRPPSTASRCSVRALLNRSD